MSMVRKRGIKEKIQYAYNPLPVASNEALYEAAGFQNLVPPTRLPFIMDWKYSTGNEAEEIELQPGDFLPLRESEVPEIVREKAEEGLVIVDDMDDEKAVLEARVKGLQAAYKFYNERGQKHVLEFKKRQRYNDDELETEREHLLWPFHLNAAKADVISAELAETRKALKSL